MNQVLKIELLTGIAKVTGREYEYIKISLNGTELNRIFIKPTEKSYYSSLLGDYSKVISK